MMVYHDEPMLNDHANSTMYSHKLSQSTLKDVLESYSKYTHAGLLALIHRFISKFHHVQSLDVTTYI